MDHAVADTATHRGSLNEKAAVAAMRPVGCAELEDLIHLPGPLTEDAVLKCLHARFSASQLYVSPAYYMLLLYITCAIYIKLWRPIIGESP